MVNHNDIGKNVKVIVPFHKLPARCADYARFTGMLRGIRVGGSLLSCQVQFTDHLVGGFLPEELEVVA
jgi:hypothetical protein